MFSTQRQGRFRFLGTKAPEEDCSPQTAAEKAGKPIGKSCAEPAASAGFAQESLRSGPAPSALARELGWHGAVSTVFYWACVTRNLISVNVASSALPGQERASADFLEVVQKHVFCALNAIFGPIYDPCTWFSSWLCPFWPSTCRNGISRLK